MSELRTSWPTRMLQIWSSFWGPKHSQIQVSTILEWIQCFGIYIWHYNGSAHTEISWTDSRLIGIPIFDHWSSPRIWGWQLACLWQTIPSVSSSQSQHCLGAHRPNTMELSLLRKAKASRCKHCFSISHQSTECTWAPEHPSPWLNQCLYSHNGVQLLYVLNGMVLWGCAQSLDVLMTTYASILCQQPHGSGQMSQRNSLPPMPIQTPDKRTVFIKVVATSRTFALPFRLLRIMSFIGLHAYRFVHVTI